VKNCDMVLAYLPLPPAGRDQSWGTLMEIAWARALDKQVILVTDDPRVVAHPVVNACAGWVLPHLDDGVEVAVGILGGYVGGKNV
jgi:nucleoside 2-deoxyribosyltransferase